MLLRAVVFDLDGVLIDSTPCHRAAFEAVLASIGINDFEYEKYAGQRTAEVIAAELRRAGRLTEPDLVAKLSEQKTQMARAELTRTNPVKDGSPEILDQLASMGYVLALASSGSRGTVEAFLRTNVCADRFQSVLTGADVTRAKPDPEIYLKTFAALQLAPDVCLVVEDAVSGIESAVRSGAPVIGLEGTCTAEALRKAGARQVAGSLREIPDLLRRL